jgi:hypothetical protein
LAGNIKILKLIVSIETVSRTLQQLGWGERKRGMLSHCQVSCDLSYQVQCDLKRSDDVEKRAMAIRVK